MYFVLAVANLQRARQAGYVFNHLGIQKGAAHFQGVGHRQPIDERQHLIREDAVELRFENPVERIAGGERAEREAYVISG